MQHKANLNEKGQVLLFVVVTMTIALAVGVGISLRTLSSVSRTTRTDTSSRVLAAAEGAIENFLVKPDTELATLSAICTESAVANVDLIIQLCSNSPTNPVCQCLVKFPSANDSIDAAAIVAIKPFGDGTGDLFVQIPADKVVETNLTGYDSSPSPVINRLKICWNPVAPATSTDLYYIAYSPSGVSKGGVCYKGDCNSNSVNKTGFYSLTNNVTISDPNYDTCFTIGHSVSSSAQLPEDVMGIRVRSLNGPSEVRYSIVAPTGILPIQGYEIIATGQLTDVSNVKATKTIVAQRSLPYLPGVFDFAIYSDTGSLD